MTNAAPAIGHNNPPRTPDEILRDCLTMRAADILQNHANLVAAAQRAPLECKDEDTAEKMTSLIKLLADNKKALESARENEKAPFLSGGRTVDNFFKGYTEKLDNARAGVNKPLEGYLLDKAAKERKRLADEAEASRKQAAAELEAALQMENAGHAGFAESAMTQAAITENQAAKATQQSYARPAALASTRSASATAGLRTRFVGVDIDREQIDLEALRQHIPVAALQTALNSFIAAGGRKIQGAVIKEETTTTIR